MQDTGQRLQDKGHKIQNTESILESEQRIDTEQIQDTDQIKDTEYIQDTEQIPDTNCNVQSQKRLDWLTYL